MEAGVVSSRFFANFEQLGYAVVSDVIRSKEREELVEALPLLKSAGTRTLLASTPFRGVVNRIRTHEVLGDLVLDLVAVQCTLFRKLADHNWAVRLHRDTVLPMRGQGGWQSAGEKEGMPMVKPDRSFLDQCVVVRVHLDGAPIEDVSVVPGSQRESGALDRSAAVPVPVPKLGALAMRPTLGHCSSKLEGSAKRRVLHYVFAPESLPSEYVWCDAV